MTRTQQQIDMTIEKARSYLETFNSRELDIHMKNSNTGNVLEYAELSLFGNVSYWNTVDIQTVLMVIMTLNDSVEHPFSDSSDDDY